MNLDSNLNKVTPKLCDFGLIESESSAASNANFTGQIRGEMRWCDMPSKIVDPRLSSIGYFYLDLSLSFLGTFEPAISVFYSSVSVKSKLTMQSEFGNWSEGRTK